MGSPTAQGTSSGGDGGLQGHPHREEAKEGVEEDGDEGLLCRRWIYSQAAKIRKIYKTHGKVIQELFCSAKHTKQSMYYDYYYSL